MGTALFGPTGAALAQNAAAATENPDVAISEVTVTGSRLQRAEGFESPTPLTVLSAAEMQKSGDTSVAAALNRVPSFRAQTTPATSIFGAGNAGANVMDLRFLGANRTLVLVDGRRFVPATRDGTFDAGLVPNALIERVEVVTGGASAAYGSDAVAGVVNMILDKDFTGIRSQLQYGRTAEDDAPETQVSLAGGTELFGGRGHIVGSVEYLKDGTAGDCFSRSWCSPNGLATWYLIGNPGGAGAGGFPATVLGPVITSTITDNGLITSGPLRGTQFNANGTVSSTPFQYGSITSPFYSLASDSTGKLVLPEKNWFHVEIPLREAFDRYTAYTHAKFDFTDTLEGFFEGSYGRAKGGNYVTDLRSTGNITIRRDNAYLPASLGTQMDQLNVTSFGLGRITLQPTEGELADVTRKTYRLATGLKGRIGDSGWTWDAYYQYGHTNFTLISPHNPIPTNFLLAVDAVRDVNGNIVCRSTLTSPNNGCKPANPFGNGLMSADSIGYFTGTSVSSTDLEQNVVAANVQGKLFDTWAGPASVAAGLEYREDKIDGTADPLSTASRFYTGNVTPIGGSVDVKEGYLETAVPLAANATLAKSLELNAAVRRTNYSTSGSVTTWKGGLVWEPIDLLRFRATRSRDIRAPNMVELFGALTSGIALVRDPVTNQDINSNTIAGGNPDLTPEVGDTWTAGVVLQPASEILGGRFRASVDHFDISLKNAIGTLGAQNIVTRCFAGDQSYCRYVTRDAGGTITAIQNLSFNLNEMTTKGFDIELGYDHPIGDISRIGLRVLATRVSDLSTIFVDGSRINRAGQDGQPTSQVSGVPDWQVDTSLDYSIASFSTSLRVHWFTDGTYDNSLIGPDQAGYAITRANSISDNSLPGRTYVDLSANYGFQIRDGARIEVYGVINNLTDQNPPPAPSSTGAYNPTLYDALGRAYRIGVRMNF
ncbi:MAG: TonB-dependent receptor [Gammaproteobacteria bacterium]